MRLHDHGVPVALFVVEWVVEEALNKDAVLARPADRFLAGQQEGLVEVVVGRGHLGRSPARGRHHMDVSGVLAAVDPERVEARLLRVAPGGQRVVAPGERHGLSVVQRGMEELAPNPGVRGEVDRAVVRPAGAIDLVRHLLVQQTVRSAGGRHHEDVRVVVGVQVGTGVGQEHDVPSVRRQLGAGLGHRVVGELKRVAAAGVHEPDLALVPVIEERRRRPVVRDPPAVRGDPETDDGEVALGDPLDAAPVVAGPGDPEEMALLVVLVEGEDVVLQFVLLLLLRSLRVGGHEEDVLAVRRELEALNGGLVAGQGSRFPASVRQEVDLRRVLLAAIREEGHVVPVRRPARATLPLLAVGQPDVSGAVHPDPSDVGGATVLLPVRVAAGVEEPGAVR